MNARDEVLGRIRQAVTDRPSADIHERRYRQAGWVGDESAGIIERFVERVVDYQALVTVVADEQQAASTISAWCAADEVVQLVVPAGVDTHWLPEGVAAVPDEPVLSATELDALGAVITTCAVAIAETGTIVLDGGAGQGRRALSLVPDVHYVIVGAEQIVLRVPDALPRLSPTRPLTWISGPSATSDIELKRVEGVHGPRRLRVVVIDADPGRKHDV